MLILVEEASAAIAVVPVAKALGHRVQYVQSTSPHLPGLERGDFEWGLYFGHASLQEYETLHDAARARNVTLLNDPAQHRDAEDLSRTVAALGALTAKTELVTSLEQLDAALTRVPPPVFIRGAMASAKERGWKACVAQDGQQARALVTTALLSGPALVREMLPLRKLEKQHVGFPVAREYRLFVLDADVLALGAYWEKTDPFGALTDRDEQEIRALAHDVARRVKVPWLAVDVGQLESGEWKVIETGDPCTCGLGAVEPRALISAVAAGLEARAGC